MPSNAHTAYLEASILMAEPIELVRILYRAALDAVGDAEAQLAAGNKDGRSKAISKAADILCELCLALNYETDPTLARNLAELYDYMRRRLLAANLDQSRTPLAEVAGLLGTMLDAWERINPDVNLIAAGV
jgi:flagellar protein FliS